MTIEKIKSKRSHSPGHEKTSPRQPSPIRSSTQKAALISKATRTLTDSGLTLDPLTIDAQRQAALDARLAEKIADYEAQLAELKRSPCTDQKNEKDLQEKLDALKKGDRRPASVVLPPLRKSHAEKTRSVRWSLSPRNTPTPIEVSPQVPQTARVESKRTKDQQRYWALMAERKPLVQKLHHIDEELSELAAELNLPPPKPSAIKPPLPRGRSGQLPPSPL